jgi:addiction module HigA family antidote
MPSRLPITTDPDWLENEHAGQMLAAEYMEPLDLTVTDLARAIDVPPERLTAVIEGVHPIDAELDLRLGRYFRISEGFFLRLQDQYELLEAKRALNGQLDRIVPRAA